VLRDALAAAQQQLDSLQQDVLALALVVEHGAVLDGVPAALDMPYSNPHLQVCAGSAAVPLSCARVSAWMWRGCWRSSAGALQGHTHACPVCRCPGCRASTAPCCSCASSQAAPRQGPGQPLLLAATPAAAAACRSPAHAARWAMQPRCALLGRRQTPLLCRQAQRWTAP
jgi:hypothetical protein